MAALATGFTILRLISKLGIRKKGNSDDWLTVLGCVRQYRWQSADPEDLHSRHVDLRNVRNNGWLG